MAEVSTGLSGAALERKITERIRSFANLLDGWHYGDGIGAVETAVNAALSINSLLVDYGARNVEVFPCIDGGILLHGYGNDDALEIQCDPDGQKHLLHERDGDLVVGRENISIDDIENYLGDLAWLPTNSYEFSFTPTITVGSWVDIPAPHSSHLHQDSGFPCLMHSAGSIVAAASASIFGVSMEGSLIEHQSIGGSGPTYYRQDVRSSLHLRPAAMNVIGTSQDLAGKSAAQSQGKTSK